jgi:hypothetical protein
MDFVWLVPESATIIAESHFLSVQCRLAFVASVVDVFRVVTESAKLVAVKDSPFHRAAELFVLRPSLGRLRADCGQHFRLEFPQNVLEGYDVLLHYVLPKKRGKEIVFGRLFAAIGRTIEPSLICLILFVKLDVAKKKPRKQRKSRKVV